MLHRIHFLKKCKLVKFTLSFLLIKVSRDWLQDTRDLPGSRGKNKVYFDYCRLNQVQKTKMLESSQNWKIILGIKVALQKNFLHNIRFLLFTSFVKRTLALLVFWRKKSHSGLFRPFFGLSLCQPSTQNFRLFLLALLKLNLLFAFLWPWWWSIW